MPDPKFYKLDLDPYLDKNNAKDPDRKSEPGDSTEKLYFEGLAVLHWSKQYSSDFQNMKVRDIM